MSTIFLMESANLFAGDHDPTASKHLSVSVVDGPAIIIGYEYRLQIEAESDLFPVEATFAGQLRTKLSAAAVVATLTTGNGGITRMTDRVR